MVKGNGKNISPDKRPPHFYKIVQPDLPNLRIPVDFMKHISNEKSERAILEGPSGGHWHAKLCKTAEGTFLQDGWQDFLRDHSLRGEEFLLFRYDGNMCFNVQIFDKNGCERNVVCTIKTQEGFGFSNGGKKRGRPLKSCFSSGKKRGRPPKNIVNSSDKKCGSPPKQFTGSAQLSQSKVCNKDPGIEAVAQRRIKTEDIVRLINEMNSPARGRLSREQPTTEEERAKVWKAAKLFTSNLPYFMRCLKRYNVFITYILKIPYRFAQAHFPSTRTEIVLRNLKGKVWYVNFVPGNTHAFSGGWTAFVRDNKLTVGDICIFELVGQLEMCVHIFRLVKKIHPHRIICLEIADISSGDRLSAVSAILRHILR